MVPVRGASSYWTTPEIIANQTWFEIPKTSLVSRYPHEWLLSGVPYYPRNTFFNPKTKQFSVLVLDNARVNLPFLSCSNILSIIIFLQIFLCKDSSISDGNLSKYFLEDDKHNQQAWYIEVPHAARPPETDRYVKLGWSSPNTYTFN